MCGIFGFAGFEEDGLLDRMDKILVHRGPDERGRYVGADRLSLGMRRLSIIDLESGSQPLFNEDRSVVAFNNGEIYNYVELIDELTRKGHRFETRSDTEVLAHGYEEWGDNFVDRLNGMFAAVIYDVRKKRLVLTRDRAGQKPVYYYHKDGRFIFASEIKAILESRHVERIPNEAAIDSYLGLRYTPQPQTFFKDVFVLPAAHRLVYVDGQVRVERYWDVPLGESEPAYSDDEEAIDAMEELFMDSIRLTMRSDVPVGAYLSGGVDSSFIVAAMCRMSEKVQTYSLGFDSPIDETGQARQLAAHLGTNHTEITCLPDDLNLLPKVVWHMDRPVGEPLIVAYYKLAEATARDLKVVLAGEGADELFAGYSFHKVIQWTERYARAIPGVVTSGLTVPALRATPVSLLNKFFAYPAFLGEKGKQRTVDYLAGYRKRTLADNYVALRTLWDEEDRRALYAADKKHLVSRDWIHQSRDGGGSFLDQLLKLQFDDWLQDFALMRQDKNSMAHSLELRLPFLDHRLIEFAFRLPGNLKVRGLKDKYIERMAARDYLPPENTRRSKNPFYLPIEYFYGHKGLNDLMDYTLDESRIKRRGYFDPDRVKALRARLDSGEFLYVKQIMSIVILELWHTIFIDREQLW
ncbi:MAG TPA: asparagine synthase (glutamine-hydrolyzing) [Rhodothermales bacterium]|nr:asparagine synthase (glutamine-hydrolyzing) [Rhodothermales bacterium]